MGMLIFGVFVFAKAFYIQRVEGAYWKSLSDSLHLEYREMDAERGTIYSEDGRMLSSSIPFLISIWILVPKVSKKKMAKG
jgi:cell division protein FtsI (penicillin-binding protein 3)